MDDATFRALVTRNPFGSCTDTEWVGIAEHLRTSLSRFLGFPLEFVGNRRAESDNIAPLLRSVGEMLPTVGVQFAGILSAAAYRGTGLKIDALLFVFVAGRRVEPERNQFLIFDYLGPEATPEWVSRGWQTSDFPEEWNPYTYRRFFEGAEAELPGCSEKRG